MATTGHETETVNVAGLKASLQQYKTDITDKTAKSLVGYYTCGTAAATAAKTITATYYTLLQGGSIKVKFTYKNTADNATLKIGNADAKPLYYAGERASANNTWEAGEVVEIFYDGTNYYANNVMGGGAGDGAFDLSKHNAVGGVLATYADLSAALNALNALDSKYKYGGMSFKFVRSSDNKYVQYRLMTTSWSTTPSDWQGVDDKATFGSKDLIKSGGVANEFLNTDYDIGKVKTYVYGSNSYVDMVLVASEGYPKTAISGYNGIVIPLVPGEKYVINNLFYSISTFSSYPIKNDSSNVKRINFVARLAEFIAAEDEVYLLVTIRLSDSTVASITRKETGLTKRVSSLENSIIETNNNLDGLTTDVGNIHTEIGEKNQTVSLTSDDYVGMFWNGTTFQAATSNFDGCYLQVTKGIVINSTSRLTYYFLTNKPTVGGTMENMSKQTAVLTYTVPENGYIFFSITKSSFTGISFSIVGAGILNDIQTLQQTDLSTDYYHKMVAHILGNRRILDNNKRPFSLIPFLKGVLTIRMDDLNASVDLAAKIVTEEYGYPLVLAAPVGNAVAPVSGITNPEDKLGETRLDICRYVVANGGEVMEHSSNTFSSDDYFNANGIKPIFIDQKVKWEEYGILVRGAAVANSFPSDSLKDVLAPYLWYYYDYSDGYGKVEPYVKPQWGSHMQIDNVTYEQICSYIDGVISDNKWGEIVFHHVNYGSNLLTETLLRQVMAYVQTKVSNDMLEVKTYAQVFDDN